MPCNLYYTEGICSAYFNNVYNDVNHKVGNILNSTRPGRAGGLELDILAKYTSTSKQSIFAIYIYNQSESQKLRQEIFIHQSTTIYIKLSKQTTSRLSSPFSNCKREYIFKPKPFDKKIEKSYPYYQTLCFDLCKMQEMMRICNKSAEFDTNFQYYFTNTEYFIKEFFNKETDKCNQIDPSLLKSIGDKFIADGERTLCEIICPQQCDFETYSYSFSNYYTPVFNFSRVFISFDNFQLTSITEQPKTTRENLIGNIGGLFGFFLGGSLMSIFEIFQLPFSLLSIIFKHMKKKKDLSSKRRKILDLFYITQKDGSILKKYQNCQQAK